MVEVLPAIMPESVVDLEEKLGLVAGLAKEIQLDIMDGAFVPEKTWPYITNESPVPLLGLGDFRFEVDLMVREPESRAEEWADAGASRIVAHVEGVQDFPRLRDFTRQRGIELCLALDVATPNEALEPYADAIDAVQFMGIEVIGYQGQPFDERVLEKIRGFRNLHPDVTISVDGGISLDTAPLLVRAGATRLVSGSAIFRSNTPALVLKTMQSL